MRIPRKPKHLKYPKRPKQSASLDVWKRYEQKRKDIDKENKKRLREWNAKKSKIEADKKQKSRIINACK